VGSGIVPWRVPGRWWVIALEVPVAVGTVVLLVLVLVGVDAVDISLLPARAASYLPVLVVLSLAGGGLNGEPGWRGFALPQVFTCLYNRTNCTLLCILTA
jgi:uncharacterized protein